jgi:preprotein translocase subunit SecF
MELFKDTNFDFLGKKWPFIIISLVLVVAGLASIALKGGFRYGIDFKGGALMTVKFAGKPPVDQIRAALSKRIRGDISVQSFTDVAENNEVVIGTELAEEKLLNANRRAMEESLQASFGQPASGKLDFNNVSRPVVLERLRDALPKGGVSMADEQIQKLAGDMFSFKDTPPRSGLINNFDQLAGVPGVNAKIIDVLKQQFYLSPFNIRQVEMVGPKVGADLKRQAVLATLYALGGMLVYIAFRFEWIYGVAAVTAVFHDTLVTLGLFSIFNKEISLTVVAALLTLVGYSMNDTIVIFDRVRENSKLTRRESMESLMNRSMNQTLGRTILTSGLTFLSAIALYLFGGPVLHGFSFALVVGIIVGTYSTIFIASPIVLFWQNYTEGRKRIAPAPASPVKPPARKSPTRTAK